MSIGIYIIFKHIDISFLIYRYAYFRFYLYDEVKNLLVESEAYYNTDVMNFPYRGLEDDKFYYIQARGATQNGIQLDTGLIKIFVNYENPEKFK